MITIPEELAKRVLDVPFDPRCRSEAGCGCSKCDARFWPRGPCLERTVAIELADARDELAALLTPKEAT